MAIQIQLRKDLSSNWSSNNPILAQGEPGLETDTNLIKLGDGTTNWNGLPYFSNLTGLVSLTANWENTYSIMQANSAIWSYVAANSAHTDNSFGNSAYTTVNSNSAGWESTETTVATNSADWSYVAANSGFSYTDFYVTGDIYATGSLSADSIKFNTEAGITPGVGELTWNADEETLEYGVNSDVTLQIGQEQLIHVKAEEDIKNGQAVYASGASGTGSGNITVRLYRAGAGDIEELYFIGVATQDISTNDFGFVSTFGKIRNVLVADTRASDDPQALSANNEGWDIGTILYVSPAEAGKYTQSKPVAPDKDIPVVMIISENGNQRTFFTRYEHGYHLSEIHDVLYNEPLSDGDLLTWNNSVSAWENQPETDPVFSSWAQSVSSNYESTYTTVQSNSAGWSNPYTQNLGFAVSDESTDISVDTGMTFRMPLAFTIEDIRASVTSAPSGSPVIIDITKNGTSIFAANSGISIDSGEETSSTSTSAYSLTATSMAPDDEIIIDVTQVGSIVAGTGLKVYFVGQTAQYQTFIIAGSNETSDLATGTSVATFRTPFAYNITDVRASLTTASSGSDVIVDINNNGESIFSTLLYVDAGETTSTTATSSVAITGASIASDSEITVDIDQVGSVTAGTGLKVYLIGTKS